MFSFFFILWRNSWQSNTNYSVCSSITNTNHDQREILSSLHCHWFEIQWSKRNMKYRVQNTICVCDQCYYWSLQCFTLIWHSWNARLKTYNLRYVQRKILFLFLAIEKYSNIVNYFSIEHFMFNFIELFKSEPLKMLKRLTSNCVSFYIKCY